MVLDDYLRMKKLFAARLVTASTGPGDRSSVTEVGSEQRVYRLHHLLLTSDLAFLQAPPLTSSLIGQLSLLLLSVVAFSCSDFDEPSFSSSRVTSSLTVFSQSQWKPFDCPEHSAH